ncbi:MAG: hypothetical protein M2R45_00934 [Verrucomicrobia subdivision 3 bacterium]|nr:hypothetical protein [Limisphaerales bacterium]MCS1414603.1 hypothetical protein [Limisphaerales bacterium]
MSPLSAEARQIQRAFDQLKTAKGKVILREIAKNGIWFTSTVAAHFRSFAKANRGHASGRCKKDWAVKLPCRPLPQRAFGDDLSKDKTPLPKWFGTIALVTNPQEKPVKLLKPLNPN